MYLSIYVFSFFLLLNRAINGSNPYCSQNVASSFLAHFFSFPIWFLSWDARTRQTGRCTHVWCVRDAAACTSNHVQFFFFFSFHDTLQLKADASWFAPIRAESNRISRISVFFGQKKKINRWGKKKKKKLKPKIPRRYRRHNFTGLNPFLLLLLLCFFVFFFLFFRQSPVYVLFCFFLLISFVFVFVLFLFFFFFFFKGLLNVGVFAVRCGAVFRPFLALHFAMRFS